MTQVSVIFPEARFGTALRPPSLRERLRDATAEAHGRLDARLGELDLTRIDGYRRFLEANAAALLPVEDALERAGITAIVPDWPDRSRRDAIAADLRRVGGQTVPLSFADPDGPAEMLGVLYVLEGSRLGAQFILRTVRKSADPAVAGTVAYLGHCAGQPLWKSFLTILEQRAAQIEDDTPAMAGAQRTFALFERAAAAA